MQKKIIIFVSLLQAVCMNSAMDFASHEQNSLSVLLRSGRYGVGTFFSGVGLASLLGAPDNNCIMNAACSGCFLLSLKNFFNDVPVVQLMMRKITLPILGASLIAAQTRDRNRSVLDHIRALCAGALVTGGLAGLLKNFLYSDKKGGALSCALFVSGALLLSQKDLKTFFGLQKGHSLKPPQEVIKKIKELTKSNPKMCQIHRLTLQYAERGRMQALPFVKRMFASYRPECNNQTPLEVEIPELEFVTTVLPYLRTEIEPNKISNDASVYNVFSVDSNDTVGLSSELARRYVSLEEYERSI